MRRLRGAGSLGTAWVGILMGLPWTGAHAQQRVFGVVESPAGGAPVGGAMVVLEDTLGLFHGRGLTGSNGLFDLPVTEAGRYRLRLDRIGYASTTTDPFDVAEGAMVERRLVAELQPIELAGLNVEGSRRCEVRPAEGISTAQVWQEVRKALAAAVWTSARGLYRFTWVHYERRLDAAARRILEDRREISGFAPTPCEKLRAVAFRACTGLHVQAEPSGSPLEECARPREFVVRTYLLVTNGFGFPVELFDGQVQRDP